MTAPRIERATEEEGDALVELCGSLHEFESIPSTPETRRSALLPLLRGDTHGMIFVHRVDNRILGYIALCFGYSIELGGRDAFIDELFVESDYRGRGIGSLLLHHALMSARQQGIAAVNMEVAKTNARAMAFYRSQGFTARDRYFLMTLPIRNP